MFNTLPRKSATGVWWWTSLGLHGLVLTALAVTPLFFPERLNVRLAYDVTPLATPFPLEPPAPVMRAPAALPVPRPKEVPVQPQPALREEVVLRAPDVTKPPTAPPTAVKLETKVPDIEIDKPRLVEPEKPKLVATRTVVTDSLPSPNVDLPAVNKPAREVQTGGFGDPNGTRNEGRPDRAATIARVGSFGLPSGPGVGNGTGGARGAQGVVASAGFGTGVTAAPNSGGQRSGTGAAVRQGGFGDGRADQTAAVRPVRPAAPSDTAAEILFKPIPDYTESARQARVEGEVLLRVTFAASGDIRILEVVKGLPQGLNESAVRAAEKIRFKPATKDGKPVDSTAIVHITFQLAY
jgi:TonB family protein